MITSSSQFSMSEPFEEGSLVPIASAEDFSASNSGQFPLQGQPASSLSTATSQYQKFQHVLGRYYQPAEIESIEAAYQFAVDHSVSQEMQSMMIKIGTILVEMRIDAGGVVAGMLQYLVIDPVTSVVRSDFTKTIDQVFGTDCLILLNDIAHFSAIERKKGKRVIKAPKNSEIADDRRSRMREQQARKIQLETVRKMFVAMGDDPRIVIFRIAEHVRQLREIDPMTAEAISLAQETRDIFAPLAGRLGMARFEIELDDLAFKIMEPEAFRRVSNLVSQVRAEQKGYIERVCDVLRTEAQKNDLHVEVYGRYKHLWSIYRKLLRNDWDIHQIYDLIAFRIIVASTEECYTMMGIVHALWSAKENRIKDFIAHPKSNGYKSLHTTVFCLDKKLAEIQIRTRKMHEDAEYGMAIHWYYKDVGDAARVDKKLNTWLQQLNDWQSDLQQNTSADEFIESGKEDYGTRSQVFVFTPHGDVLDLPYGSTPVDFAYRIHSKLGNTCAGARIISTETGLSTRMVPLDYRLENGQIVEIITRKDAHPTRDWLKFAKTASAKTHINRYLKQYEREIFIIVGRERLQRETKQLNLGSIDDIGDEILNDVAQSLNFEKADDLFAALGSEAVRISAVIQEIKLHLPTPVLEDLESATTEEQGSASSTDLVLNLSGARGLLARIANCCHPLPGDQIVGYISRGRGIVIHHQQCRSLKRLREREGERLLQVNWDQMLQEWYDAAIIVIANDRKGLLRDVTQEINEMHVNMSNVSSSTNRKNITTITLTLHIQNTKQLEDAIRRINSVGDVKQVGRDTRSFAGTEAIAKA